jgi:renal tumor antigen
MESNPVHEFRILRKLGEGAYADVYLVRSVKDQQVYAEKRLKKRYRSFDEVNQLIEVIALRTLSKHPNIIHLHSVMYDSQSSHVALIFEVAEMNMLEFLSQQTSPLDEQTVLLLTYQLLKGIAYVHSHGLFHRDIKPENCLINTQTLELKIADFGSAGSVAGRTKFTEYVATRWYRAPECILTSGTYGPAVDVWAVGCVLFEMLTARPLFPGKHQLDQLNQIHSVLGTPSRDLLAHFQMGQENSKVGFAFPQREKQSFRNLIPNATDLVVNLMEKMIVYDPIDRVTAHDALEHSVFRELRRADAEWQHSNHAVPFSAFFLNHAPAEPGPGSGPAAVADGENTPPDANPPPRSLLAIHAAPVGASELRRLGPPRQPEHHMRQLLFQPGGKTTFGRIPKPGPAGLFQRPKPDMVQPSLPPISFRPLRKPD